jgi:hypothetical protein
MRKALALGTAAASIAGMVAFAAPAGAQDTAVNFTLTGGGLSLSVPTNPAVTLNSGTLNVGALSVTAALNPTTVTDNRGQLLGSWKVQVSGSDYVNPSATSGYTIPKANGAMYIDVANAAALVGTGGLVTTGVATSANKASLTAVAAGSEPTLVNGTTAGTGSLTYTPSLSVTIPAQATAGTYSGTVTQTAS